ncbi:helix-turn-helix domain-containing protein [Streptomyces sp. NPDC001407]|uniref:helix-turn-helix domain-containing protein n=1 Tax=Streptomyces sp. NPDC001407 TaxID=3364573 RepID=UPI0036B0BDDD
MAEQHRPSCAKRWRDSATTNGWTNERLVDEIHSCCHVSRLRAHRLARGLSLEAAAAEYRHMCAGDSTTPKLDVDKLSQYEAGVVSPKAVIVDLLCRLYRTDAQGLGFAGDYRPKTQQGQRGVAVSGGRVPGQSGGVSLMPAVPGHATNAFDQLLDDARRSVDRTLASASVSPAQLDLLDERILYLRQQYLYTPPEPILSLLLAELREVQALSSERQPAAIQVRLSEMTAMLATLIADALMKLGVLRQSRAWYATARAAADDSGNIELRARVRAQAAMLPYYYGPLDAAITLAREARLLMHNRPRATGALAAAAEARALAQLGDIEGANNAIHMAQNIFDRATDGEGEEAFAFPERRLLLYLSGAYTHLRRSSLARSVQRQALALYPDRTSIDPALLRLEEAICLAQDHSPTEACELAQATYLGVPEPHRTPILGARARHVIAALPPAIRSGTAAHDLGEILALSAGAV